MQDHKTLLRPAAGAIRQTQAVDLAPLKGTGLGLSHSCPQGVSMPQSARHVIVRSVGPAYGVKPLLRRPILLGWPEQRADHHQQQHHQRAWLAADRFTVADLIMSDVLRVSKVRAYGDRPATEAYIERVTTRPAFQKAHSDQITHFATADKERSNRG